MKTELSIGPQPSMRASARIRIVAMAKSARATQTIFHQGSCRTRNLTLCIPITFLLVDPVFLSIRQSLSRHSPGSPIQMASSAKQNKQAATTAARPSAPAASAASFQSNGPSISLPLIFIARALLPGQFGHIGGS